MKLTKFFVAAVVLLAAVGAAFADEAKYNELLAKGKDYEAKKQWVYAMGTYWNAILEYPQGAKDANDGFNRIRAGFAEYNKPVGTYIGFAEYNKSVGNFIGTGNPGPGEYDIFSCYDGWINVCREFEVYWNEHSDEIYYVPEVKYEKGEADMKNRTMTYDFKGKIDFTQKFSTIWHCIGDSFRKAYRDNWNDIPAQWPAVSMFKDSKTIPVVRFISACNNELATIYDPGDRSFEDLGNYVIVGGGKLDFPYKTPKEYYVPAWNNYASIYTSLDDKPNLEIKIKVSDENGKDFGTYISKITTNIITKEKEFSFKIQGISREDMGAFDNEELIVKVESLLSKTRNSTAELNIPQGLNERIIFKDVKHTAGPVIKLYREGNNSNPLELYAKEAKIAEIVSKGKLESGVLKPRKIDKNCYTRIENLQGDSVATNVEGVVFAIPLPSYESTKFKTKIDGLPVYCYDISVRITDDMSYMIDSFIDEMNKRYNADFQVGITSDGKYCIYRAITDADRKAEEERIAAEKAEEERIAAEKKAEEERIAAEMQAAEERIAAERKAEEEQRMANRIKNGELIYAAFWGDKSLTSVIIPSSVTSIGSSAFRDCTSLTNVTIPSSVTSIYYDAFDGCSSLKEIHFTGTKAHWMALYRVGKDVVVHCSDGDVNKNWYESITDIVIPNGVTSICSSAFKGCTSLTSVTIPSSVKHINNWAFEDCTSLKTVNYAGSKNDWKEIKIDNWNKGNKPLLKAKIRQ